MIDPVGADALEPYLRAMLAENQQHNLTAIRDIDQARVLHSLDSLAIQGLDLDPRRCLDLGTGNGFPGTALRVLYPDADVTLLDRTGKKLDAIERALLAAELPRVEVLHLDASQAAHTHRDRMGTFDLVTVRAVGRPRAVSQLARPFLARGGHLVLWLDQRTEAPTDLPSYERIQSFDYALPEPAARDRRLGHYQRI